MQWFCTVFSLYVQLVLTTAHAVLLSLKGHCECSAVKMSCYYFGHQGTCRTCASCTSGAPTNAARACLSVKAGDMLVSCAQCGGVRPAYAEDCGKYPMLRREAEEESSSSTMTSAAQSFSFTDALPFGMGVPF